MGACGKSITSGKFAAESSVSSETAALSNCPTNSETPDRPETSLAILRTLRRFFPRSRCRISVRNDRADIERGAAGNLSADSGTDSPPGGDVQLKDQHLIEGMIFVTDSSTFVNK